MTGTRAWLNRLNGALGVALTWAFAWALAGALIQAASQLLPSPGLRAFVAAFDAPPEMLTLAIPGFISGVFFSMVVVATERHRRFDALSLSRFAIWGAIGASMLMLIAALQMAADLAEHQSVQESLQQGVRWLTAVILGLFVPLGTLSGAGHLLLARAAEPWRASLRQLLAIEPRTARSHPTI
ncbi:MAG TPA: hypothetical protein VFV98_17960 [Vicinamibacterales bacterium]|nr:hypothetical protein [Vicinamibacterales bacterium]